MNITTEKAIIACKHYHAMTESEMAISTEDFEALYRCAVWLSHKATGDDRELGIYTALNMGVQMLVTIQEHECPQCEYTIQ